MKKTSPRKKRRTRREVKSLVGRYHRSGKSVREFCEAEGVELSSMYKWLKREGRGGGPALVEVKPPPAEAPAKAFTVCTKHGYRIEVPPGFEAAAFKRLLEVLEA